MLNRARSAVLVLSLCPATLLSCRSFAPAAPGQQGAVAPSQPLRTIVMLPAGFDTSRTYTLLVALHGSGGTAATFAPAFSSFASASLLVAVPEGEAEVAGGGHSWFPMTRDRSVWESADRRSVGRVLDVVADIRARFRIGRVFVLGFSQGATLAYMIGLRNPSLVSGVLAISGGMPYIDREGSIVHAQDVASARNVKLFVARGRSDNLVGAKIFAAQGDYFAARGYAVTSYEFAGAHYLTPELLDQVLRWIREYPRS